MLANVMNLGGAQPYVHVQVEGGMDSDPHGIKGGWWLSNFSRKILKPGRHGNIQPSNFTLPLLTMSWKRVVDRLDQ
jgi:hypothetical protein